MFCQYWMHCDISGNQVSDGMEVRRATVTDAPGIAGVHVAAERAAYCGFLPLIVLDALSKEKQEAAWRERIESGDSTTFVACVNEDVWGWINLGGSRDLDAGQRTSEIRAMYVSPDYWRHGVGGALWEHARTFLLQETACSCVTLWVFEQNDIARRFYEKIGFRLEREIDKTVERGGQKFRVLRYRHTLLSDQCCIS
jgi:ribosomal protein S18 acetylase RimI-like enzyme